MLKLLQWFRARASIETNFVMGINFEETQVLQVWKDWG